MSEPVLKVTDLKKSYGAIKAVNGVSFEVMPGEIFGVIGPNGSGKTTMFNSVLGQITPDAGRIELNGQRHHGRLADAPEPAGRGPHVPDLQVFGKMTVRDNLLVAAQEHAGSMWSRLFAPGDSGLAPKADALIDQFRIRHVATRRPASCQLWPAEAGRHRDGLHERAGAWCCSTSPAPASTRAWSVASARCSKQLNAARRAPSS